MENKENFFEYELYKLIPLSHKDEASFTNFVTDSPTLKAASTVLSTNIINIKKLKLKTKIRRNKEGN